MSSQQLTMDERSMIAPMRMLSLSIRHIAPHWGGPPARIVVNFGGTVIGPRPTLAIQIV